MGRGKGAGKGKGTGRVRARRGSDLLLGVLDVVGHEDVVEDGAWLGVGLGLGSGLGLGLGLVAHHARVAPRERAVLLHVPDVRGVAQLVAVHAWLG